MSDRILSSVINQKAVFQIQLQVLTIIAAQVNFVIEAQIGFAAQADNDLLDL